uniref:ABC transporter permease n=1 Tax=Acetatifactor sp. TaxID=1872090 RepID=UPI004056AEF2
MKKLVLSISGAVSFVIFLILFAVTNHMGNAQDSQQMAARWSEEKDVAQVSCFFSSNAGISVDTIKEFEYSLDDALQEASIVSESENEGARLWADAYSADGKIYVSSDRAGLEADAIGIGGDFFLFHPLKLLTGSYFSGNDLNHDYCVIDEDAAWQLFGSNDVAGMTVYIKGIPHIVTGVIERPRGRLEEAAGLEDTLIYVSYETLNELGSNNGINHYEIVMPNPVSNFAINLVREKLGTNEKEVQVLENTSRYSFVNRIKVVLDFGTRSMNGKAIIYPYWENIARGYEDMIAFLTIWMILFLVYPATILLVVFIKWWRHKGWTFKDVWYYIKDKAERQAEKRRMKAYEKKEKLE